MSWLSRQPFWTFLEPVHALAPCRRSTGATNHINDGSATCLRASKLTCSTAGQTSLGLFVTPVFDKPPEKSIFMYVSQLLFSSKLNVAFCNQNHHGNLSFFCTGLRSGLFLGFKKILGLCLMPRHSLAKKKKKSTASIQFALNIYLDTVRHKS